jgi:hypothetical protein
MVEAMIEFICFNMNEVIYCKVKMKDFIYVVEGHFEYFGRK